MAIVYNPMKIKDVKETKNKVRILICNSNNEILVANYHGIYMLPGGKVEDNIISDKIKKRNLIREIKEEVGIDINEKNIEYLEYLLHYQENYPTIDGKTINRLVETNYYKIKMDIDLNTIKNNLTDREKEGKFKLEWVKKEDLRNKLINSTSNNPRKDFFHNELRIILAKYMLYNDVDLMASDIRKFKEKNSIYIDLHTHTCYSDGELTPNELIKLAIEKRIGTLAITDHDTLEGIKTINKNDAFIINSGIKIINGIELSAKVDKGRMHILGYGIDIYNKELNKKLAELKNINVNYVFSIIEQLKKDYSIYFTYDELKELINFNHNLGRPDIARLLVKNRYVATIQEAFDKYLIDAYNKIGNRKKGIDYNECINLILKSNGIPVLAHPKTLELNDKDLLYLLKDMINCGLMGIEVYHSNHTKEETNKYLEIANELGLFVSGGSDYHGVKTKPDIEIGTGKNNNLKIKQLSILKKMN